MKKVAPFFVALGAISYGLPASLFKLAKAGGLSDSAILCFVFFFACLFLNLVAACLPKEKRQVTDHKRRNLVILSGSSMALTNTFYLLSLSHVPVALAAVMLIQSMWLSIALDCLIKRHWPTLLQVGVILLIIFGTVLATGVLNLQQKISLWGLFLAFLSAFAYALTLQFTGKLGQELHPLNKARLMSIGAFLVIAVIWGPQLFQGVSLVKGLAWGSFTSLFAMVLPLTCYSYFMPKVKASTGAIISSLELPASIIFAFFILGEKINGWQLIGVVIIIIAVVLSAREQDSCAVPTNSVQSKKS